MIVTGLAVPPGAGWIPYHKGPLSDPSAGATDREGRIPVDQQDSRVFIRIFVNEPSTNACPLMASEMALASNSHRAVKEKQAGFLRVHYPESMTSPRPFGGLKHSSNRFPALSTRGRLREPPGDLPRHLRSANAAAATHPNTGKAGHSTAFLVLPTGQPFVKSEALHTRV